MPEGQYTGEKACYVYVTDTNDNFIVLTDKTLGDLPEAGLTPFTNQDAVNPPRRFEYRRVFWQGVLDGRTVRKSLIVNTAGALWDDSSNQVTIDGVDGSTTGRKGERLTYVCAADPTPPV